MVTLSEAKAIKANKHIASKYKFEEPQKEPSEPAISKETQKSNASGTRNRNSNKNDKVSEKPEQTKSSEPENK